MNDEPFYKENASKRYDFYVIIVTDETEKSTFGINDKIDAFTTSEYIFNLYLSFYRKAFAEVDTVITTFKNITYDEFIYAVKKDINVTINEYDWIYLEPIDLIDRYLIASGTLLDMLSEDIYCTDEWSEYYVPELYGAKEMFVENELYFGSPFSIIKQLMNRINDYIELYTIVMNQDVLYQIEHNMTKDEISMLSNKYKLDKLITQYEWYDIFCESYLKLSYLINNFILLY